MKPLHFHQKLILFMMFAFVTAGLVSCDDDDMVDPTIPVTGDKVEFDLMSVSDPGISGDVTFEELQDGSTRITIDLNGTTSGSTHPSHIHFNTAAEGGGIAISLTPVDGSSGMSETIVARLDDGMTVSYDQLVDFDGYVNVHLSANDLATLVAQGDIGQNVLTGETMSFDLGSVADPAISGQATFAKRKNNETLVTLDLDGTPAGGSHPAHIHFNTAAEGGAIAVSFIPVDGETGISKTNVATTDDNATITYNDLVSFDGYINVHLSAQDLATLVAQGDIGQNALTGNSVIYDLEQRDVAGVSGSVSFYERVNNEALAIIELDGSVMGDHPAHIHQGSVATSPGGILITFNNVNGAGLSKTNIASDDSGNSVTYDQITMIDGYVNVHMSIDDLGTLVAQGDIGMNAE